MTNNKTFVVLSFCFRCVCLLSHLALARSRAGVGLLDYSSKRLTIWKALYALGCSSTFGMALVFPGGTWIIALCFHVLTHTFAKRDRSAAGQTMERHGTGGSEHRIREAMPWLRDGRVVLCISIWLREGVWCRGARTRSLCRSTLVILCAATVSGLYCVEAYRPER